MEGEEVWMEVRQCGGGKGAKDEGIWRMSKCGGCGEELWGGYGGVEDE